MKKHIRCNVCGRKRKPGHEKRCGTKNAYNPGCVKYEKFNYAEYIALKNQIAREKKEAKEKENSEKVEQKEPAILEETKTKDVISLPLENNASQVIEEDKSTLVEEVKKYENT